MIGEMDPIEESLLDRAVMDAYKMKGITPDPDTQTKEPPLIEDLYKSLIGMEDQKAQSLAARFEKYIKGSFAGIFNQKTTVKLDNKFVVFGIRNLEDALRPVAMHIILDHIWTVVKKTLKKRILVVDEAWYLMQYADSAAFLRGIVKRGRKYYLGVTTITQDVDDFLETPYGKEIVTNSSIQILLKQHSAAIDQIGDVFYLSEGEKQLLLTADKGEGIFFAGQNHVAIRVIASESEHKLITSNPEEVLKMKSEGKIPSLKAVETDALINNGVIKPQVVTKTSISTSENIEESNQGTNPSGPKAFGPPPSTTADLRLDKGGKTPEPTVVEAEPVVEEARPTQNPPLPPFEKGAEKTAEPKVNLTEDIMAKEVVIPSHEDLLQKRIAEMEGKASEEIKAHEEKMKKEKAEKEKMPASTSGFGSLPKYQELFKSYSSSGGGLGKLPPLPPLPKFEPPKTVVVGEQKPLSKPVFVNLPKEEVKIPQPPQLAKAKLQNELGQLPPKKIEFVEPTVTASNDGQKVNIQLPQTDKPIQVTQTTVPNASLQKPANKDDKGMDYDKLFGNSGT